MRKFLPIAALALLPTLAHAGSITVFEDRGLNGNHWTTNAAVNDLDNTSWQGEVRSIAVNSGTWQVCSQSNFINCTTLTAGQRADAAQLGLHDTMIASFREVAPTAAYGQPAYTNVNYNAATGYDAEWNNPPNGFFSKSHGEDNYHRPTPANAESATYNQGLTWSGQNAPAPAPVAYSDAAPMQQGCMASVEQAMHERYGAGRVRFSGDEMSGRVSIRNAHRTNYSCDGGQINLWK